MHVLLKTEKNLKIKKKNKNPTGPFCELHNLANKWRLETIFLILKSPACILWVRQELCNSTAVQGADGAATRKTRGPKKAVAADKKPGGFHSHSASTNTITVWPSFRMWRLKGQGRGKATKKIKKKKKKKKMQTCQPPESWQRAVHKDACSLHCVSLSYKHCNFQFIKWPVM